MCPGWRSDDDSLGPDLVDQPQRIGEKLGAGGARPRPLKRGGVGVGDAGHGDVRASREPREMLRAEGAGPGDQHAQLRLAFAHCRVSILLINAALDIAPTLRMLAMCR
jgi:hypothetical protein